MALKKTNSAREEQSARHRSAKRPKKLSSWAQRGIMGGLERSDRSVVPWGQSKDLRGGGARDKRRQVMGEHLPWVFARSFHLRVTTRPIFRHLRPGYWSSFDSARSLNSLPPLR